METGSHTILATTTSKIHNSSLPVKKVHINQNNRVENNSNNYKYNYNKIKNKSEKEKSVAALKKNVKEKRANSNYS